MNQKYEKTYNQKTLHESNSYFLNHGRSSQNAINFDHSPNNQEKQLNNCSFSSTNPKNEDINEVTISDKPAMNQLNEPNEVKQQQKLQLNYNPRSNNENFLAVSYFSSNNFLLKKDQICDDTIYGNDKQFVSNNNEREIDDKNM
jgi:hypothetical protein